MGYRYGVQVWGTGGVQVWGTGGVQVGLGTSGRDDLRLLSSLVMLGRQCFACHVRVRFRVRVRVRVSVKVGVKVKVR